MVWPLKASGFQSARQIVKQPVTHLRIANIECARFGIQRRLRPIHPDTELQTVPVGVVRNGQQAREEIFSDRDTNRPRRETIRHQCETSPGQARRSRESCVARAPHRPAFRSPNYYSRATDNSDSSRLEDSSSTCRTQGRSTLPSASVPPLNAPTKTVGVSKVSCGLRRVRNGPGTGFKPTAPRRDVESRSTRQPVRPLNSMPTYQPLCESRGLSTANHGITSRGSPFRG